MANFLGFQVTIWSGFSAINKNDNFVDIPADEYHYSGIAIVDYLKNGNFRLAIVLLVISIFFYLIFK